jgi:hypothetical protein
MNRIYDRGHGGGTAWRWQTIQKYAIENGWKNGAELGVWYGETFKYLVNNCPELTMLGVDLYEPQPDNDGPQKYYPGEHGHLWEHDVYYNDMMKFCSKTNGRASIFKGTTTDAAKTVEDESLDFVFIDADHSFRGVDTDITHWYSKVKPGGYIIGHDIHWIGVKEAVEKHFGTDYHTADDFIWYVVK